MAILEKFFGMSVEIPEHLRYQDKQGLWAQVQGGEVVFGMTEPALLLSRGLSELEWLVEEGEVVQHGAVVAFAITGKVLYLEAPTSGTIRFNHVLRANPSLALEDPYGRGWLFRILPSGSPDDIWRRFSEATYYEQQLRNSEGLRNPAGAKGRGTGMCNAVYKGIQGGLAGGCC